MIRLTKSQILLLHEQLITETGGSSGLRDEGMLDSALNAPFQTLPLVKRICIRLFSKRQLGFASVLSKTIHLWTGNKRIGAHAMLVFLALNGVELQHLQAELSDVILQLAAGEIEATDLLRWILEHQI